MILLGSKVIYLLGATGIIVKLSAGFSKTIVNLFLTPMVKFNYPTTLM